MATYQYSDEESVRAEGAVILVRLVQSEAVQAGLDVRDRDSGKMDNREPYRSATKVARRYVPKVLSRGSHWATLGSSYARAVKGAMFLGR